MIYKISPHYLSFKQDTLQRWTGNISTPLVILPQGDSNFLVGNLSPNTSYGFGIVFSGDVERFDFPSARVNVTTLPLPVISYLFTFQFYFFLNFL